MYSMGCFQVYCISYEQKLDSYYSIDRRFYFVRQSQNGMLAIKEEAMWAKQQEPTTFDALGRNYDYYN